MCVCVCVLFSTVPYSSTVVTWSWGWLGLLYVGLGLGLDWPGSSPVRSIFELGLGSRLRFGLRRCKSAEDKEKLCMIDRWDY